LNSVAGMPAEFHTAIQQFEAGRRAEAAGISRAILTELTGDLSASKMLGVIAASWVDFAKAAACCRDCVHAAPDNDAIATNLAQALFELGQHKEALTLLKPAAQLRRQTGFRLFCLNGNLA